MNYDLIVIGGGPGGYVSAIRASQLGMKTALIEKGELGGTCLNRGCVPTKALMHSSEMYRQALGFSSAGIRVDGLSFDFSGMHRHKNDIVLKLRLGVAQLLKANNVDVIAGTGVVEDTGRVRANGETLLCEKILIAAGSAPSLPPIEGAKLAGVVTSDELLLDEGVFYDKLLIIGGGVIGVEMASIYSALGCKVTIIEALDRILPMMDREISQNLSMILKKRGVEIFTSARVNAIARQDDSLLCRFTAKSSDKEAEAGGVLICAGRRPYTAGLFAPGAEPKMERGFIVVDDKYRTSIRNVYAVGDVIGGFQLAHAAQAQGSAAVEFMAGKDKPSTDPALVPACVYTSPEIACVGVTADEAKAGGKNVYVGKYVMNSNAKSMIEEQERSFIKLVFDADSDALLGAQLMCARATDMIAELTTAISAGLTREALVRAMRPHPTFSEGVTEALEAACGHSIHTMPPRR